MHANLEEATKVVFPYSLLFLPFVFYARNGTSLRGEQESFFKLCGRPVELTILEDHQPPPVEHSINQISSNQYESPLYINITRKRLHRPQICHPCKYILHAVPWVLLDKDHKIP